MASNRNSKITLVEKTPNQSQQRHEIPTQKPLTNGLVNRALSFRPSLEYRCHFFGGSDVPQDKACTFVWLGVFVVVVPSRRGLGRIAAALDLC